MKCKIGSEILTLHNVRFIPDLSKSMYSLFQHIQSLGHKLESSSQDGLYITFPSFRTKAIIGQHDIYLDAKLLSCDATAENITTTSSMFSDSFCQNIAQLQSNIQEETDHLDNILLKLRRYYNEVKTCGFLLKF